MSIQDEIKEKEKSIRDSLNSIDEKQLKSDLAIANYNALDIPLECEIITDPKPEYKKIINEVRDSILYRHKVKTVEIPEINRIAVLPGVITAHHDQYDNNNVYYTNEYPDGANDYAFIIQTGKYTQGKSSVPSYLFLFEDGRVAISSYYKKFNSSDPQSYFGIMERPIECTSKELRTKIIASEAYYRMNKNITPTQPSKPVQQPKPSSGCYVATSIYGSYDCPEVWTLRRYRDKVLLNNIFGSLFVKMYYKISPYMVKHYGNTKPFKMFFKFVLDKFVSKLNKKGISNKRYIDN